MGRATHKQGLAEGDKGLDRSSRKLLLELQAEDGYGQANKPKLWFLYREDGEKRLIRHQG